MKIAVIGDTHLGYSRFYEDSFTQAKAAFEDAQEKADLILFLGDLYDSRVPTLQVLGEAITIFSKIKKNVYAIHGNHERRSKGNLNAVELLEKAGLLTHLHMRGEPFTHEGEEVFIAGMGNVPDDLASKALGRLKGEITPPENAFSILMLHQSFKEYVYGENLASIHDLEQLGYTLYLNGHIHATKEGMEGRFLIPGSTVLTQLTKEETKPKGYILYDTKEKTHRFVEIPSRKFILEEKTFEGATPQEVSERINEAEDALRKENPEAIIRFTLKGTLKEGFRPTDLNLPRTPNTHIDNRLNRVQLKGEMEKIRELRKNNVPVQELSEQKLRERLKGKITLFDPQELFERLLEGPEAAREALKRKPSKKL
ncbi:metallophosphoesterase family protein [Candidatus Micrarchaeota archaeon]|nr:metallophosphoesterase family protein [Candidatus Micrarchaeota archaeon]